MWVLCESVPDPEVGPKAILSSLGSSRSLNSIGYESYRRPRVEFENRRLSFLFQTPCGKSHLAFSPLAREQDDILVSDCQI